MSEEKLKSDGVVIAKSFQNAFFLHKWIKQGGSFRFKNYPFAIKLVGNGGPMVEVQLIAVPVNTEYKAHINPAKAPAVKKKIELEEEEAIEM